MIPYYSLEVLAVLKANLKLSPGTWRKVMHPISAYVSAYIQEAAARTSLQP